MQAYDIADEMLRERLRNGASPAAPIHDAVLAARAESDEVRTDKAATSHRRDGTGDTQEPVAWAVENASVATGLAWLTKREAVDFSFQHGGRIVPLYSHPQPTLTDAEREAIDWYANFPDGIHAATLRKLLERTK